ncbi:DUF6313 family protein [Streptomyces bottropensis]|uniref:DUF6313 family protein n=1 Tax=Streptomyces bottropensis TaxID=42235 RepID=UPI0036B6906C
MLEQHRNIHHWLLVVGLPIACIWLVLMGVAAWRLGWGTAYETMVGIRSPVGSKEPAWAWIASSGGWLIMPAIVGAAVGAWVADRVSRRRTLSDEEILEEALEEARRNRARRAQGDL